MSITDIPWDAISKGGVGVIIAFLFLRMLSFVREMQNDNHQHAREQQHAQADLMRELSTKHESTHASVTYAIDRNTDALNILVRKIDGGRNAVSQR